MFKYNVPNLNVLIFFSPQATTSTKYHDSNPEFKQFLKIPLMVIQVASVLNLKCLVLILLLPKVRGSFPC